MDRRVEMREARRAKRSRRRGAVWADGFRCCRCKRTFDGEPGRTNGCGPFCDACTAEVWQEREIKTTDGRSKVCVWCGERPTRGKNYSECKICHRHREWLLQVIRVSDRPARYVASREAKYGPEREARRRAAETPAGELVEEESPVRSEQDARLDRLESMLSKLIEELGG